MKKALAVLLTMTLTAGMLLGCSSGKKDSEGGKEDKGSGEKVITFNIGQEPTTLDPGLNSGVDGTMVLNHIYEGLMIEKDNKFECAAAESYDVSDDGKTTNGQTESRFVHRILNLRGNVLLIRK